MCVCNLFNMKSNVTVKNILNIFGPVNKYKFETNNFLSIYKIPNHYDNFKRLSLFFGDWKRIKSDCVYLNSRKDLDNLLFLSKIANFNIPKEFNSRVNEDGLIECLDYFKNYKFVYFGSLNNFTPRDDLKSLIIPLDLTNNSFALNLTKPFINTLENINHFDKILLCTNDNETWIRVHKLLKYQ